MKQGSASRSGHYGGKVEPRSRVVNPGAVADMGSMKGNHVMEQGDLPFRTRQLFGGRGLEAPLASHTTHRGGSQGKY